MNSAFQKWSHFSNSKYQLAFHFLLSVSDFFNFVFKFEFPSFFQKCQITVKMFISKDKAKEKHFVSQVLVVNQHLKRK